ncbi:hypothetical protein [Butyrivibrio sp. JL13D10]|uniref:hypothetical protein n=1 Tax=Butyrivibrio sp. JL13D10 TaxID=3236815 RepID=UPI0038B54142
MDITKYKIADFVIELRGDSIYMDDRFKLFLCDNSEKTDMVLNIVEKRKKFPEYILNKGTRIGIFHAYWKKDKIIQFFPYQEHLGVRLVECRNNFHDVTYYLCDKRDSAYAKMIGYEEYIDQMQGVIFNLFQESFFNMILFENAMSIHSASIIYENKAIAFSASSGTGKSTQANMWNRVLGTEVLDGDVTVCREIDNKLYVYGLPWCGSSGQFVNKRVELEALVFLKQAKENKVRVPSLKEKIGLIFSSTFSETWDDEMAKKRAKITENIISKAKILEYSCNMNESAVLVLKEFLRNSEY